MGEGAQRISWWGLQVSGRESESSVNECLFESERQLSKLGGLESETECVGEYEYSSGRIEDVVSLLYLSSVRFVAGGGLQGRYSTQYGKEGCSTRVSSRLLPVLPLPLFSSPLLLFPVHLGRRQLRPQSRASRPGRCAAAGSDAQRVRAAPGPPCGTMKLRSKAAALLLLALAVLLLALLSLRARQDLEPPGFPARPEAAPQGRHAPAPTLPPEPRAFPGAAGPRFPRRRPPRLRPGAGRPRAASRGKLAR